jgi:hypothetical protein
LRRVSRKLISCRTKLDPARLDSVVGLAYRSVLAGRRSCGPGVCPFADRFGVARAGRVVGVKWWKLAAAMSPGYKGGAQKT